MDFEAVFKLLLDNFKKEDIQFALIGGFAMHTAGHSRATQDIDFLIAQENAPKVKKIMLSFGYDLVHESEDVSNFLGKMRELGKVDFLLAHRKYTRSMLLRAQEKDIFDGKVKIKVISPEDIIGLKVQSSANEPDRYQQDLIDIETLIKINYNNLNMDQIREYFDLYERGQELDNILEKVKNA